MNRGTQALRACNQSSPAAAPHAGPTTAVHASVRIDRRCARRPICGQETLGGDRTTSLGEGGLGEESLGEGSLGQGSLGEMTRHRRIGGNHAMRRRMMMNVNMCLQAVRLVGMGARQSRRKLNGDQDDHRANKLPKLWVRVHQTHIITGIPALHSLGQRWLTRGAELFIFQSPSGQQRFTRLR
jgi:hypothetical protein